MRVSLRVRHQHGSKLYFRASGCEYDSVFSLQILNYPMTAAAPHTITTSLQVLQDRQCDHEDFNRATNTIQRSAYQVMVLKQVQNIQIYNLILYCEISQLQVTSTQSVVTVLFTCAWLRPRRTSISAYHDQLFRGCGRL